VPCHSTGYPTLATAAPASSVLIVDSSPTGLQMGVLLARAGCHVWLTEEAETAMAFAGDLRPDLAIIEMRVGRVSGFELMRALRASCNEMRVVVVTAFASVASALAAVRDGAEDYLPKPVSPAQVLGLVGHRAVDSCANKWMELSDASLCYIQEILRECGSMSATARALGLDRRSLRRTLTRAIAGGQALQRRKRRVRRSSGGGDPDSPRDLAETLAAQHGVVIGVRRPAQALT
jgi:two-component system response regulator RegA